MSKEKQIEEMKLTPLDILANDIYQSCPDLKENYCGDTNCVACLANALYHAGYRKQIEGEWIIKGLANPKCSACNSYNRCGDKSDFCPNCGAKMKGGAE